MCKLKIKNKLNTYFYVFDSIRTVLKKNNALIKQNNTALSVLYFGLCNHLYACMDAYVTLFEKENYYMCKTVDRILLDLYIKTRMLSMADDPEDLAKKIMDGDKIKKADLSRIYGQTKGILVDTDLCHKFDEIDDGYAINQPVDAKYGHRVGVLESRYREDCKYVHPNIPCVWSYTTDKQNDWRVIIEEDASSFVDLAQKINMFLSEVLKKIVSQQRGLK